MMAAAVTASRPVGRTTRVSGRRNATLLGLLAWLFGVLFFLPFAWMVLTSLHSESAAATNPPSIGAGLTLQGYREFFGAGTG